MSTTNGSLVRIDATASAISFAVIRVQEQTIIPAERSSATQAYKSTCFSLQSALRSQPTHLIFYNFDLLYLDGKDLRENPLLERRAKLRELVDRHSDSRIQFSEEFIGDAVAFFRACAAHELEGIVSKLATSRYRSGRSKTWLKTKCFTEGKFLLLGIDRDRKTQAPRALLARAERDNLIYAGAAFIGFASRRP